MGEGRRGHSTLLVIGVVGAAIAGMVATALTVHRSTAVPSADHVVWPAGIAPIAAAVEEIRGLEFERTVPVRRVRGSASASPAVDLDDTSVATLTAAVEPLVLFGVMDAPASTARLPRAASITVAGVYSPSRREIRIYGPTHTLFDRGVLAHELTHALEDQHISAKERRGPPLDGSSLAKRAVIEGSASLVERRYLEQRLPVPSLRAGHAETPPSREQHVQVWEWFGALSDAPYSLGASYVETALAEGRRSWDDILRSTPLSDVAIVDPLRDPASSWLDNITVGAGRVLAPASDARPTALEVFMLLASRVGAADALAVVNRSSGATLSVSDRGNRRCADLVLATSVPNDSALLATLNRWVASAGAANASVASFPAGTQRRPPPGSIVLSSCGAPAARLGAVAVPVTQLAARAAAIARVSRLDVDRAEISCVAAAVVDDLAYRDDLQQSIERQSRPTFHAFSDVYGRAKEQCAIERADDVKQA